MSIRTHNSFQDDAFDGCPKMKWSPRCICSNHSRTANMRCDRVVTTFISSDSSGIELLSWRFCCVKNNGTVVLRFAARCCSCHAVIWSQDSSPSQRLQPHLYSSRAALNARWRELASRLHSNPLHTSPSKSSRDLAPIPCWVLLDMHSTSIQDPAISQSLGPCSTLTLAGTEDLTRAVDVPSSSRSGRGCVLSRFWPLLGPASPSSSPGSQYISFALSSESQTSTFFIVSNSIRSTFHRRGFARCFHRHLDISLFKRSGIALIFSCDQCLVHFNLRFHISSPSVSLQTFVTFRIVVHLLANPCSTLFCVRCCCLHMNSYVRTCRTNDRHTIHSQVCPGDVASTWRQRQMDNLKLQSATIVCAPRQNPSQCGCARVVCVVCNVHVFLRHVTE